MSYIYLFLKSYVLYFFIVLVLSFNIFLVTVEYQQVYELYTAKLIHNQYIVIYSNLLLRDDI